MTNAAEIEQEAVAGQGSGLECVVLASQDAVLTPSQLELRRLVVNSVTAPTSKQAYGAALDLLFSFAAGRPLTRALLQEWKAGMEGLAPSTINVRLSAVRKLVSEAIRSGMLGIEEAA